METVNNKTLEKLKYELVRDGVVSYETLEKAEELANVQSINIGQALINSGIFAEDTLLNFWKASCTFLMLIWKIMNPIQNVLNMFRSRMQEDTA